MDQLQIKDLEIFAYHGLFPSEKELGQKFVVSAILSYDMTQKEWLFQVCLCQHLQG